jgi:drug/metabolite transporter (DMT)-like permease
MPAVLFLTVSLTWGLTWYAIRLQLGATPAVVSAFWRFALAAACMWPVLVATGRARRAAPRQHLWFALLGLTLFSGNFLLIYNAERDIPSGLVSVVFSMATVFNALNQWLFERVGAGRRTVAGSLLGTLGVALLFADQLAAPAGAHYLRGVALALGGTYAFSLGNMVSRRALADGTTLANAVARGMCWGTAILAAVALASGDRLVPDVSAAWLGGLAYLVVGGTLVGFVAYLALVERIGPARAAYATVVSPIIALTVSSVLEGYTWTPAAMLGVPLVLVGNLVIFAPLGRPRR